MRLRRRKTPIVDRYGPGAAIALLAEADSVNVFYGRRGAQRYTPALLALKELGFVFDSLATAQEWDWPRWGRRILVSRNDRVLYEAFPGAKHIEIGFAHDA